MFTEGKSSLPNQLLLMQARRRQEQVGIGFFLKKKLLSFEPTFTT